MRGKKFAVKWITTLVATTIFAAMVAVAGYPGAAALADPARPPVGRSLTTAALLDSLQRTGFLYFWEQANPVNGLIRDRSQNWSPCSIAAQGFGISAICIGIDHGWVSREAGRDRIMLGMQTLWDGPQSDASSGTNGYRGLFYHFLDINSGLRTWDSELSSIDTALLMAGILDARQYFDSADPGDVELRALADSLYLRVDWDFMRSGGGAIRMGWKPGTGFSGFVYWIGYNEAMILYLLALGSPTYPVPEFTWGYWTTGYQWETHYGHSYVIFPPLFGHQYSHCWVDFRNNWDEYMQLRGITYFENSRRATLAQREYCIANPGGWADYGPETWGLTASDGPDGYSARGAPPAQNDDGTITPTAPASSIVFAPEVVIPTLHNLYDTYGDMIWGRYGFKDAFNISRFWFASDYIGIDQGPIVIMIENYLNERVWDRFMSNPYVQTGLMRAGFLTIVGVGDDGDDGDDLVGDPRLVVDQNVPNPFRGTATVAYRLAEPGPATLRLYDLRGRCLRTVVAESANKGFNYFNLDARGLPSGSYLYSVEAGNSRAWNRCIIIR
jgi:hypothetical protein